MKKFNFSVDISLIYAIIQIVSELDDLPDGEAAEYSPLTIRFWPDLFEQNRGNPVTQSYRACNMAASCDLPVWRCYSTSKQTHFIEDYG